MASRNQPGDGRAYCEQQNNNIGPRCAPDRFSIARLLRTLESSFAEHFVCEPENESTTMIRNHKRAFIFAGIVAASASAALGLTVAAIRKTESRHEIAPVAVPGSNRSVPLKLQAPAPLPLPDTYRSKLLSILENFAPDQETDPSILCHQLRLWSAYRDSKLFKTVSTMPTAFGEASAIRQRVLALMGRDQSVLIKATKGYRFARRSSHTPTDPPLVAGESHPGQCLAGFAESGVSLSHRFPLKQDSCYVADLLTDAAWSISTKEEIEWRVVALALYRPDVPQWRNKFGESFDWPSITRILLRSLDDMQGGGTSTPCYGTHSLYALAVLDRVNDQTKLWDPKLASEVGDRLRAVSLQLERSQRPDGSWDRAWFCPQPVSISGQTEMERLLITGHHLEWIALRPECDRPSENVLARAGDFVCGILSRRASKDILSHLCPCSHGLRAYLVAGVRFVSLAKKGN
jgi:hypothetical protein